jgi:hypothetical protein
MQRRNFLILGSLVGLSPYAVGKTTHLTDKTVKEVKKTIQAVQEHFFPEGSKIPSARSMYSTQYLLDAITHESYDKDIRAFVIEGAKELELREKDQFTSLSYKEKERALRSYEETNYGSNWLGRIMTLTMEGMFGDPIYGSNTKESGWKALHTKGGNPRPKTRYIV